MLVIIWYSCNFLRNGRFLFKHFSLIITRKSFGDHAKNSVTSPLLTVNHCWCQETKGLALTCGINKLVISSVVLSQSTCVTDGRTQTEFRLPRPR